jgi:hypothetical protein
VRRPNMTHTWYWAWDLERQGCLLSIETKGHMLRW